MFSRNVQVDLIDSKIVIALNAPELMPLVEKHHGKVNIQITKPDSPGSEQQNGAAHALMNELFIFMMKHSNNPIMDFVAFKEYTKLQLGFAYYFEDPERGTIAVPKRWARATKSERCSFIDKLLAYIHEVGADSEKKVQEIIQGMTPDHISGEA